MKTALALLAPALLLAGTAAVADDLMPATASATTTSAAGALPDSLPSSLPDSLPGALPASPAAAIDPLADVPTELPSTATTATATMPSAAMPSAAMPSAAMPSAAMPSATMPSAATPYATMPSTVMPSAMEPPGTLPADTMPSAAMPSATMPPASPQQATMASLQHPLPTSVAPGAGFATLDGAMFREVMPGISRSLIWGDDTRGNYGAYTHFRAGADNGQRAHPSDIRIVVISGAYLYQDGTGRKRVAAGDFIRIPAGHPHWSGGDPQEGALFYEEANGTAGMAPALP